MYYENSLRNNARGDEYFKNFFSYFVSRVLNILTITQSPVVCRVGFDAVSAT